MGLDWGGQAACVRLTPWQGLQEFPRFFCLFVCLFVLISGLSLLSVSRPLNALLLKGNGSLGNQQASICSLQFGILLFREIGIGIILFFNCLLLLFYSAPLSVLVTVTLCSLSYLLGTWLDLCCFVYTRNLLSLLFGLPAIWTSSGSFVVLVGVR